ncbi:MAG: hypothetical protein NXH85_09935 [Pseudomonadaceae bacterium]|nr:hypothetical protein [Pseudomonadaceae bacterium]
MGHRRHIVASWLAWLSIVFGGFLLGIGNAVTGALGSVDHSAHMSAPSTDAAGAAHAHHHHHQPSPESPVLVAFQPPTVPASFMEALPAHCLFCLDGVTPAPLGVQEALLLGVTRLASSWLGGWCSTWPASNTRNPHPARAPPIFS